MNETRRTRALLIRLEPVLVGLFLACWSATVLTFAGLVDLAGALGVSLYGLYSTAAALGWVSGNVYVARSRGAEGVIRRRMRVVYLLGPPSIVSLLRAMAPAEEQLAAPLVPLYAFGVYIVLFLVPVVLRRPSRWRPFR